MELFLREVELEVAMEVLGGKARETGLAAETRTSQVVSEG